MELELLIALLPVVFMFHDFEEIIFFKPWLTKNKDLVRHRFPKISKRILPHFEKLSTAAFTLAVAEEFVLLSIITYSSILWENYYFWFAAFMAFSIHLLGHIIQWVIFGKYIPTIITSFLSLPYCIYTLSKFIQANIMDFYEFITWTIIGLIIMILNLALAHKLASSYNNWVNKLM